MSNRAWRWHDPCAAPVTTREVDEAGRKKGVETGGGSGNREFGGRAIAKHAASIGLVTRRYRGAVLTTAEPVAVGGNADVAPRRVTSVDSVGRY